MAEDTAGDKAAIQDYESVRAAAEKNFTDGHSDWLKDSTVDVLAGVWKLAERCSEFLWDDVRGYGALLRRRNLAPSACVSELEQHIDDLVSQTRRRKWIPCLAELGECADVPAQAEEDWDHIVQYLAYYFHQVIEPWLWGHGKEPSGTELRPTRGKRGPKPNFEIHMQVARAVGCVATDRDWPQKLDEIAKELDRMRVPVPNTWKDHGCTSWCDQLRSERHLVTEAVRYRLKSARKAAAKTLR